MTQWVMEHDSRVGLPKTRSAETFFVGTEK